MLIKTPRNRISTGIFASFIFFAVFATVSMGYSQFASAAAGKCYDGGKQQNDGKVVFHELKCPADAYYDGKKQTPEPGKCYAEDPFMGNWWSNPAGLGYSECKHVSSNIAVVVPLPPSGSASAPAVKSKKKESALSSSTTKPSCYVARPSGYEITGCPANEQLGAGKCYNLQTRGTNYSIDEIDCKTGSSLGNKIDSVSTKSPVGELTPEQKKTLEPDCTDPVLKDSSTCKAPLDCTDPDNADAAQCSFTKAILVPIVNVLSMAVGVIVVLSIVVAGIQYITSNGNPQQVATAKNRIFNSVMALVVYIFGFALLQWLIPGGIFR